MTTRRNNMFHDRGEMFMLSWIIKIAQSAESLDDLKFQLNKMSRMQSKWITDCMPGFTTSTLEGRSLITNHYFVQYKDKKYSLMSRPAANNKIESFIFWSEETATQCMVDFYSDDPIDDIFIEDKIATAIGIADDWVIVDKPMVLQYTVGAI